MAPPAPENLFSPSAYGVAAARLGFTVRYHRTSRLLHALTIARQDGSLTHLLRSLAKTNLLVLDDWMRDPISVQNAQDILEVLDDRFGHSATFIASQVPVVDWHLRIPDPTLADAILDRLVHNAHSIHLEGESNESSGRSGPCRTLEVKSSCQFSLPLAVRHPPFKLCAFTEMRSRSSPTLFSNGMASSLMWIRGLICGWLNWALCTSKKPAN